ncbi:MAG: cyclase family protein [Simkaniaceae bacterium]|nr:MAG: cyclase family protein [Simkaniaceae bacterium]
MNKMLKQFKVIDLTHPLSPEIPTWNGSCGYSLEVKMDYDQMFRVQKMKIHAGLGTHMDAPSHRFEGRASIAEISLDDLIVPTFVIDVSEKAHGDYELSVEEVKAYEKKYGAILEGSLVMIQTGWSRFWTEPNKYRNVDGNGQMHFPAVSGEAGKIFIERGVVGLAIDTLSPDCLNPSFPVHEILLGKGKYIIENVANGFKLPPVGAYVIALPLRAEKATEAPMRLIGLIPKG